MIPTSACRNPAAWRSGRWERSRRVRAVSMARSEYRTLPTPPAAPPGRPGSDRFRGHPQPSQRRGERGPGDRPASSPRGTASYTWDEPSTASRSCDSCGGEKDGPKRPTHRRFIHATTPRRPVSYSRQFRTREAFWTYFRWGRVKLVMRDLGSRGGGQLLTEIASCAPRQPERPAPLAESFRR